MQDIHTQGLSAVIAGATGMVGSALLELLLQHPGYSKITALSRRPLDFTHPKLKVLISDGKDLKALAQDLSADHVYCCLGTTIKNAGSKAAFEAVDLDYPVLLAYICRQLKADHFLLVSAVGAKPDSWIFYSSVKGRCENKIRAMGYPRLSVFRPSLLIGKRNESRPGEKLGIFLSKYIDPLLRGGLQKYRSVSAERLASDMIQIAFRTEPGFRVYEYGRNSHFNSIVK